MDKLIVILGILVYIIIGPFLSIWALDTLFPSLNIPFTVETWFAAAILSAGVYTRPYKKG
jgi:hypothetical protein